MTARNVKTLKHEKTIQITYNPTQPISKLLFLCRIVRMLEPIPVFQAVKAGKQPGRMASPSQEKHLAHLQTFSLLGNPMSQQFEDIYCEHFCMNHWPN